jgi:hypothetical protein
MLKKLGVIEIPPRSGDGVLAFSVASADGKRSFHLGGQVSLLT